MLSTSYYRNHLPVDSAVCVVNTGPAQQDFEWGGLSVSQMFFFFGGGGGGGSIGMLPWEN